MPAVKYNSDIHLGQRDRLENPNIMQHYFNNSMKRKTQLIVQGFSILCLGFPWSFILPHEFLDQLIKFCGNFYQYFYWNCSDLIYYLGKIMPFFMVFIYVSIYLDILSRPSIKFGNYLHTYTFLVRFITDFLSFSN